MVALNLPNNWHTKKINYIQRLFILFLRIFVKVVRHCHDHEGWIPVTFMLGAFVTIVLQRWWSVVSNIGFIDKYVFVS